MTVTVKRTTHLKITPEKALDAMVSTAIGLLQRRTARGIDKDGRPFRSYSSSYMAQLMRGGENGKVDLPITGGFLADIRELRREIVPGRASAWIGSGTGTSEGRKSKARVRKSKKLKAMIGPMRPGRMAVSGGRSPPHNVLGAYLHYGTVHMPARPWAGFTPEDRKIIAAKAAKMITARAK